MDSGFSVLAALIELKKIGIYASAVAKKRRYWPRHIDGDAINNYMNGKPVGTQDARRGVLDGEEFNVFVMKEQKYTFIMMATYGTMREVEDGNARRTINNSVVSFKYIEPYYNHYKFRHQIDDHNAKRHQPISVEEVLGVRNWAKRHFTWLIAVTEVNVKLGITKNEKISMIAHRRILAKQLMGYSDGLEEVDEGRSLRRSKRRRRFRDHELRKKPQNCGRWDENLKNWVHVATVYCDLPCAKCGKRCRTYCECNKGIALCPQCHGQHVVDVKQSF
jgi:hypothetical protein